MKIEHPAEDNPYQRQLQRQQKEAAPSTVLPGPTRPVTRSVGKPKQPKKTLVPSHPTSPSSKQPKKATQKPKKQKQTETKQTDEEQF